MADTDADETRERTTCRYGAKSSICRAADEPSDPPGGLFGLVRPSPKGRTSAHGYGHRDRNVPGADVLRYRCNLPVRPSPVAVTMTPGGHALPRAAKAQQSSSTPPQAAPGAETAIPTPLPQQPQRPDEPSQDAPSDTELLRIHVAGTDPYAFTELIRRHRARLWAVAGAILRDPQDADDAVQEATLRALKYAHGFRGESSVYIWLRTLTVNVATTMAAKRVRLARRIADQDPSLTPDQAATRANSTIELDELLRWALSEVPDAQRAAFVLVQLLDMPVEQVAELQGVRPATVYTRIHRARLHLVTLLDYRQVIDLLHRLDS